MFPLILIRILFAVSMVFVIGYVFGNFSKTKTLATISKVAAVLAIILFVAANGLLIRFGGSWNRDKNKPWSVCYAQSKDSTIVK